MKIVEIIQLTKMLLDDQGEWFVENRAGTKVNNFLSEWINEAQNALIEDYYKMNDERALRTLYVSAEGLSNGASITDLLYPRSCKIYIGSNVKRNGRSASYLDYDKFLSRNKYYSATAAKTLNYTIMYNQSDKSILYFTPSEATATVRGVDTDVPVTAEIWYIRKPDKFYFDKDDVNSVNTHSLELPDEYHVEVCALAAKLINDIDVGEQERGQLVNPNMRLDLTDITMKGKQ